MRFLSMCIYDWVEIPVVVGLAPIAVPPAKAVIPRGAPVLNRCAPVFSRTAVVARPLEVPGGRRPWLVRSAFWKIFFLVRKFFKIRINEKVYQIVNLLFMNSDIWVSLKINCRWHSNNGKLEGFSLEPTNLYLKNWSSCLFWLVEDEYRK